MRLTLAAALLTLAACSRTSEGPTPTLTAATNPRQANVQPARVCSAQGGTAGWRINLTGSGFAPMPLDVLTASPRVDMPEVSLKSAEGTVTSLARERVFFVNTGKLEVDIPTSDAQPPVTWAPGNYAVQVKNPLGTQGELAQALRVVPPPTLTAVRATEGFSQTEKTPLALDGSNFRADEPPTIVLTGANLSSVTLTEVAVVSATQVTANLPAGTAAGTYDVTLTNPEGCAVVLLRGLVVNYAQLGTLSVDPRFGWQHRNQAITLYNTTSASNQGFSSGAPEIFLVAPLKASPSQWVEIPLRRVAYVSPSVVTAVVPACSGNAALPITAADCTTGIAPGGPYALKIRDANGATGEVPASIGFSVVANAPPVITSISPSAIDTRGLTSGSNPLVVRGTNFGAGAKVRLLQQLAGGRIRACDLPATGTPSATELRATVPTSLTQASCVEYTDKGVQEAATGGLSLSAGLFVVRVQNTADTAYANFSGLIVTTPSANPSNGPAVTSRLAQARADFPLVTATDDLGQPYLYALGGTNGTTALDSVEMAPVTLFGDVGGVCSGGTCAFHTLARTPLPEPRRGLTAVVRTVPGDTSYVFVLGGMRPDGTTVKAVERAQVLKAADAPSLMPPEVRTNAAGSGLGAGTFYYRVSAVLKADNAFNPGGETLPSDEYPATVGAAGNGEAVLTWSCQPNAARYRLYRTVDANAPSGSELLLDEVDAAVADCSGSPLPTETYTDRNTSLPSGDAPLPSGALGSWVHVKDLTVERGQAATLAVGNDVYVTGGYCATAGNGCPSANASLASVERATFQPNSATLGDFTAVSNLGSARRRHSLAVADANSAPNSFTSTSPNNTQDAWLIAMGGHTGSALVNNVIEVGRVKTSSGTVASPNFSNASYNTAGSHGGWALVVANYLFQAGATGGTGFLFRSDLACPGSGNNVGQCTAANSFNGNFNNTGRTGASYQQGGPRFLAGTTLFRAFVYAAGGFPNDAGGTPTSSIERIIY